MEIKKRQRAFYLCRSFTELPSPDYNPIQNVLIGARLLLSIRAFEQGEIYVGILVNAAFPHKGQT